MVGVFPASKCPIGSGLAVDNMHTKPVSEDNSGRNLDEIVPPPEMESDYTGMRAAHMTALRWVLAVGIVCRHNSSVS